MSKFWSILPSSWSLPENRKCLNLFRSIVTLIVITSALAIVFSVSRSRWSFVQNLKGKIERVENEKKDLNCPNKCVHTRTPSWKSNYLTILGEQEEDRMDGLVSKNDFYNYNDKDVSGPIVDTFNGQIRGKILRSREGRRYAAFYQIPYAIPPLREFRFQNPRPFTEKWSGIRDGVKRGGMESACIQLKDGVMMGKEDCLYLSVFTPRVVFNSTMTKSNLWPVMFYILGGANLRGRQNRYGADYIMDSNVVLVLIDFRLGAMGHLSTEDSEILGNQAYKDQVMGLRWVKKNIHKFGGNRKKVLIFGNSSGGTAVHAHLLSPMSRGLFSRAVCQSGTIFPIIPSTRRPLEAARRLGSTLNCPNVRNTTQLHQCLIKADARQIVQNVGNILDWPPISKEATPKDDGKLGQNFMKKYPLEVIQEQGGFDTKIPLIIGCTSAEAYPLAYKILQSPPTTPKTLYDSWEQVAPKYFNFLDDPEHKMAHTVRQFYFGNLTTTHFNGADVRYNLTNLMSDVSCLHPSNLVAHFYGKNGGRAYFYWMSRETLKSYGDPVKINFPPPSPGPSHADEVQLFFPYEIFPFISKGSVDFNFSKEVIRIWTQFADTGEPGVHHNNWTPILDTGSKWMELNDGFQMIQPLSARLSFLDTVPFNWSLYLPPTIYIYR